MEFITNSQNETIVLGRCLARGLKKGSVIIARGTLGAGKTVIAKGLAQGLGIKQIVNSPTFNIMKVYHGKELNFYHIDAYRLEDKNAVSDIGFDEAIGNPDGISFIEWPDFISTWYAHEENVISITIEMLGKTKRKITIKEETKHE